MSPLRVTSWNIELCTSRPAENGDSPSQHDTCDVLLHWQISHVENSNISCSKTNISLLYFCLVQPSLVSIEYVLQPNNYVDKKYFHRWFSGNTRTLIITLQPPSDKTFHLLFLLGKTQTNFLPKFGVAPQQMWTSQLGLQKNGVISPVQED